MKPVLAAKLRQISVLALGLILPLLSAFTANGGDDPDTFVLLHDPFKKPQQLLPATQNPVTSKKEENLFLTASSLTATLRAGSNSMVIVDGKAIKLGETIDGYRLTEVREHSAVFTKNRQQHILEIDKINEIK